MSKLIALVATAVMVNGERTLIQPGEELPDLNKHDQAELVAAGAARDPARSKKDQEDAAAAAAASAAEFETARAAVQAAQASTQDGSQKTAPPTAKTAKASK